MSSRRINAPLPFLGHQDPATGRRLCCHCGTVTPPRRRDWCSDECAQLWLIRCGDQNAARRHVWARDQGVCALCRVDTITNQEERDAITQHRERFPGQPYVHRLGSWDADHIVPLAEGGAREPENLRTLCRPCHKRVTAELRARITARRRGVAS